MNPIAGGGRPSAQRADLEAAACERGVRLEWHPTGGPGHAAEIAAAVAREGAELVLVLGGDGTYNEAARGLVGTQCSLGILPGGTTSVLAFEIGLPRRPGPALNAVLAGRDRPMRIGRTSHGDIVLLMLSAGPDSVVLDRVSPAMKRMGGRAAIALQAMRELLRRASLPSFHVRFNDMVAVAGWAIVGKSRYYAGPFRATPGADPFLPELEAVVQTIPGRAAALSFAAGLVRSRHMHRRGVVRFLGGEFRLEPNGVGSPIPYQVDGDVKGVLPVTVRIDDESLLLRVPEPEAGTDARPPEA